MKYKKACNATTLSSFIPGQDRAQRGTSKSLSPCWSRSLTLENLRQIGLHLPREGLSRQDSGGSPKLVKWSSNHAERHNRLVPPPRDWRGLSPRTPTRSVHVRSSSLGTGQGGFPSRRGSAPCSARWRAARKHRLDGRGRALTRLVWSLCPPAHTPMHARRGKRDATGEGGGRQ